VPTGGWERVLPRSNIHLISIPGDHHTMMRDPANRAILGDRLSEALRAPPLVLPRHGRKFNPLMPLHATHINEAPLLCVPGAGASITSLMEFVSTLGERQPVYGLQPRGIDLAELPHGSVEAAAMCNLHAMDNLNLMGPVHLLGHSHGGAVAFQMALLLQEQGRPVASVTLIDSPPPETTSSAVSDMTDPQIFQEFVDAIRWTFEKTLDLGEDVIAFGKTQPLVDQLHAAMVSAGLLPMRSNSTLLRGPLTAFAAARRTTYSPVKTYSGKVRLALVRDPLLDAVDDMKQQESVAASWRRCVTELDVWHGPGHHFSILRAPHVLSLAQWWKQGIE